jgi:hypothetical protein
MTSIFVPPSSAHVPIPDPVIRTDSFQYPQCTCGHLSTSHDRGNYPHGLQRCNEPLCNCERFVMHHDERHCYGETRRLGAG